VMQEVCLNEPFFHGTTKFRNFLVSLLPATDEWLTFSRSIPIFFSIFSFLLFMLYTYTYLLSFFCLNVTPFHSLLQLIWAAPYTQQLCTLRPFPIASLIFENI
jgi:hypothetical protein